MDHGYDHSREGSQEIVPSEPDQLSDQVGLKLFSILVEATSLSGVHAYSHEQQSDLSASIQSKCSGSDAKVLPSERTALLGKELTSATEQRQPRRFFRHGPTQSEKTACLCVWRRSG